MQHLENDMDELFRRAGENYPLRAGDGDWEKIAVKISAKASPERITHQKGERNKRIALLFLLLLLLSVYWLMPTVTSSKKGLVSNVNKLVKEKNDTSSQKSVGFEKMIADQKDEAGEPGKEKNQGTNYQAASVRQKADRPVNGLKMINSISLDDSTFAENLWENQPQTETGITIAGKPFLQETATNEKTDPVAPKNEVGTLGKIPLSIEITNSSLKGTAKQAIGLTGNQNSRKEKKAALWKAKKLYVGLTFGPDLSKVQSMSFSYTGMNAGVLAGLSVNPKLSFETGISWNLKYYNSDGKDFSMAKVGASMAAGMIINNLEGQSALVEIPIKVKYNVISKTKSTIFIAGGISSYIMTHEKNKYNITINGNKEKMTGIYDKNNYGFPAVVNISVGYEHPLTKFLQIRAEPFLKIPLKGIGVGSLPITSTGLQLAVISRLK